VFNAAGKRVATGMPAPPEAYALSEFIEKLHTGGGIFIDAAERHVAELIEGIERDEQRRILLEKRAGFCGIRERLEALATVLEGLAETLEGEKESRAVALASVVRVLVAQCEPWWKGLSAREKAYVLTPLYMSLHHLERYAKTRSAYHAEAAETLALLALARLDEKAPRKEAEN
jgi:hypothetical protein